MAENEDGQEKTEEPTSKRLDDAKKKGQIARSKELNTMAITLIGGMALVGMSGSLGQGLVKIMSSNLTIPREEMFDVMAMTRRLVSSIQDALLMLAPFFAVVVVVAVLSSIALGGMAFSAQAMTPKLSKMNPLKGLKRLFSIKGLIELAKAMAKFFLVGGATALVLWLTLDSFINLSGMGLEPAIRELVNLVGWAFVLVSSTLILVAAVDVPFQIWDHKKQLKMTRQEIREEMKDTEGRPEVRGRIRQLQREMATRRMMDEVPKADVIVTNPTHYAVALRYNQARMNAPVVVAKGTELVAANIRRVGTEHAVPIIESPMLARAIYFHTELGEAIPAGLYLAVAKILAYVFQLKAYVPAQGKKPAEPGELQIPDELKVPE
ncbi:flagellar biosynthesis protein FlhB [Sedimenticola selenatireducens]|uniref:Flagellar biosynthetic protein FlhB n=1 Tax=Sedimenticola selenatireducens TaxID=191960 RepID=A0A2N6CS53_9GAMM|nr:flagellar biosynthesis protein FlhB [Sedimenticola selenatireducens]PLX59885.1 MAG: flagellar biosynthetic protein FlhB [Sedimenticola selenatireducens]